MLLTGIFVFSAQVLVYAYVARVYPAAARGAALGATSGVGRLRAIAGRLITGVLLNAGLAYLWGFYLFALVAVVGTLSVAVVNRAAAEEPLISGRQNAGAPVRPADLRHRRRSAGTPRGEELLSVVRLWRVQRSGDWH